mmetsp:Transcript_40046/g.114578  ORF Transcript_40046/g.114578 Transcript_40046/m.114578 type:complete len:309 (+) Transcript_40046:49-975(+)
MTIACTHARLWLILAAHTQSSGRAHHPEHHTLVLASSPDLRFAAIACAQECGDDAARIDLCIPLATSPGAGEGLRRHRDLHGRPAQGWPSLVLLVGLICPLPHALARTKLLCKGLLQLVLHAHQRRLPLRDLLCRSLCTAAGPICGRSGDLLRVDGRRARVRTELGLEARALQVPKHSPRRVPGRLLLGRLRIAAELVRHSQHRDLDDGAALTVLATVAPLRRDSGTRTVGATERLQHLHLRSLLVWRRRPAGTAVLLQQQLLAPLTHEKGQGALCGVALRLLFRWVPFSGHMVWHAVQNKGHRAAEF